MRKVPALDPTRSGRRVSLTGPIPGAGRRLELSLEAGLVSGRPPHIPESGRDLRMILMAFRRARRAGCRMPAENDCPYCAASDRSGGPWKRVALRRPFAPPRPAHRGRPTHAMSQQGRPQPCLRPSEPDAVSAMARRLRSSAGDAREALRTIASTGGDHGPGGVANARMARCPWVRATCSGGLRSDSDGPGPSTLRTAVGGRSLAGLRFRPPAVETRVSGWRSDNSLGRVRLRCRSGCPTS